MFNPQNHSKIYPVSFPCGLYWYYSKSVRTGIIKAQDTFSNSQRPVFSLGLCQHQQINLWKLFGLKWSSKLQEHRGRFCCTSLCALDTKNDIGPDFLWEITYFSKTMLLLREPFLTMFYTINSSPLLVTKYVVMLTIILSGYQ